MANYTKLFNSIITSTIWTEDDKTRIVWITMLAIADQHGEVQASIPGLARVSGVSLEAAETAINKFLAPDPYSRTPDDEGRRIEKIEGGWALLNHGKYRLMASAEDSKKANADRQKRHREKHTRNATVTKSNATVTHSNGKVTVKTDIAEAKADAEAKAKVETKQIELLSCPISSDESEILKTLWDLFPPKSRERSSKKQFAEAWRKTKIKPSLETLRKSLAAWNASAKWIDGFSEGAHIWVTNAQWENTPMQAANTVTSIPDDEAVLLMGAIDSIRSSWQKIPWNNEDRAAMIKYQEQLAALTDDDLQVLKAYFESTAEGYFRPDNRSKFCESLSGIWTACERWKKATGYRAPNSRDSLYYGS
jgi:hypothetical protein